MTIFWQFLKLKKNVFDGSCCSSVSVRFFLPFMEVVQLFLFLRFFTLIVFSFDILYICGRFSIFLAAWQLFVSFVNFYWFLITLFFFLTIFSLLNVLLLLFKLLLVWFQTIVKLSWRLLVDNFWQIFWQLLIGFW